MKRFDNLVANLKVALAKNPGLHYSLPKNPTEMDLREAAFVIESYLGACVVGEDSLESWLDSYHFWLQGAMIRG